MPNCGNCGTPMEDGTLVCPECDFGGVAGETSVTDHDRWCLECGQSLESANKPPGMRYSEENHYRCRGCRAFVVVNTTGKDETAACKFLAEAKMKARVLEEILLKVLRPWEE